MSKHAILTGSITNGFCISQVVDDSTTAKRIVSRCLAARQMAEAIEVQKPSVLNKKKKRDYNEGDHYVLFGSGTGNGGVTIFGPFPDDDEAEEFGEAYRGEDEEWELFVVENQTPLDGEASSDVSDAIDLAKADGDEVVVNLADGWTLRSGSAELTSGDYVRLCTPQGDEYAYWDKEEWRSDPALVMGAIINSAAGLRMSMDESPAPASPRG